jgi:hypothetical protein
MSVGGSRMEWIEEDEEGKETATSVSNANIFTATHGRINASMHQCKYFSFSA